MLTATLSHLYNLSLLLNATVWFTDRSIRVGNVFLAVGTAEMGNKRPPYMTDHKVFVIKPIQPSGGSCVSVERQYGPSFLFVCVINVRRDVKEVIGVTQEEITKKNI